MLLLCDGDGVDVGVYSSLYGLLEKDIEYAGYGYHLLCLRRLGVADVVEEEQVAVEEDEDDAKMREAWESRKKVVGVEEEEEENLYELLGIGHLGFSASEKQIKRAYQKSILVHHPDKLQQASSDCVEDAMFLRVQRAWEILGNKEKRRGYDSQFAFDDSIPSGREDVDFYELFGPVFERNGRFAVHKPVPQLGSDETDIAKVSRFYAYWQRFESWRDFSKFDEFKDGDVDNAESRMEKRWMLKQNESARAKAKKKEYERVKTLVRRAMEKDPRLLRAKVEAQVAKARAFQEKKERIEAEKRAKKEAEEAEEAARVEAERVRLEGERVEREQKQASKKAFKKCIRMIRKACDRRDLLDAVELLNGHYTAEEEIRHILLAFNDGDGGPELLLKESAIVLEKQEEGRRLVEARLEEDRQKRLEKKREKQFAPWSADELSSLAKAMKKFPGGTRNRWMMVCKYLNTIPGSTVERTQEDCIQQSKIMASDTEKRKDLGTSKAAFDQFQKKLAPSEAVWSNEQQAALEAALKKFPASMDKNERWKSIAAAVEGKSKKECVARFKELRAKVLAKKK
mmetsp:Transcript_10573/g.17253  ORF Transcript_10573/g.17253 Transcript_10573/m.17253 type:complete len:570 (+) Transcript_10573:45-1754(+)